MAWRGVAWQFVFLIDTLPRVVMSCRCVRACVRCESPAFFFGGGRGVFVYTCSSCSCSVPGLGLVLGFRFSSALRGRMGGRRNRTGQDSGKRNLLTFERYNIALLPTYLSNLPDLPDQPSMGYA